MAEGWKTDERVTRREKIKCNEDVRYRSQKGKSVMDICLGEIIIISQGKSAIFVSLFRCDIGGTGVSECHQLSQYYERVFGSPCTSQ